MEPTPPPQVKTLLILHFAFFIGQILFAIICLALVGFKLFPAVLGKYGPECILAAALLEIIAIFTANFLFKRSLKKINVIPTGLSAKMDKYRSANVTRWAILETTAIIVLVLFLLTNQYLILIIVIALLFVFYTMRPTAPNIANDLQVRESDVEKLA